MKTFLILLTAITLTACGSDADLASSASDKTTIDAIQESKISYPNTKKGDVVDTYFSSQVADPYRWLEDDLSAETGAWVKQQNKVTFDYLDKIPYRNELKQRLEKLWNYEKIRAPFKEGEYTYFYKNDGLQNQYAVYRQKGDGEVILFLDPNTFSDDGTTSMSQLKFSKDGSIAAYAISEGGSDWRKIIVIDVETLEQLEKPIINAKFSNIAWQGNDGFYYSSYEKPDGSELSARTDQHRLFYHKLGTAQAEDEVVFGDSEGQERHYVWGYLTEDDRYLVIAGSASTSGNDLHIKDLREPDNPLVNLVDHFESDTYVVENVGSKLFLTTNLNAPNKKVVTVDFNNPSAQNWVEFIPEAENVLAMSSGGGSFFAHYMVDATSKVYQYDFEGNKVREVVLPGLGSASEISGKLDEKILYYSFSNYKTPGTIYAFNVADGASTVYSKSGAEFNGDDYQSTQVFYKSKDGTKVPMIITHRKGLELDGNNPTILYGYGGFDISITPKFSIATAFWLEAGGVYAVANLRGGGEYGKAWHDAGTQLKKQNVFDDFIAAAEHLIELGYASSDTLAVRGRSNGGLLIGAVINQRPELFKAAIATVGVMDMLRYHTFTAGAGWAYDYGTSEQSQEMFEYLYGYSPLHNIKAGVHYPATLVTTADHDDRVVPAHSFKYAAELQAKQAGDAPTLIRIETQAGHGAGTPTAKLVEKFTDIYSFIFYNFGIEPNFTN